MVLRGRKLNVSLVFILQSYFKVPKTIRPNATHYFIREIPKKRELQQTASNHSSEEPYLFLVNDTTLSSDNPLRFRKNLL